jgi:hypothetical protein
LAGEFEQPDRKPMAIRAEAAIKPYWWVFMPIHSARERPISVGVSRLRYCVLLSVVVVWVVVDWEPFGLSGEGASERVSFVVEVLFSTELVAGTGAAGAGAAAGVV